MIRFAFDLYPRADPVSGALVTRFTQLQQAEYRKEANGTGAGRIAIRATKSQAELIDPAGLQYIRVVRINEDLSEKVVGGTFLENGDFEALTSRSTKLLTFGGAGQLSYLGRDVMAPHSYIAGEYGIIVTQDPFDDLWRLYANGPAAGGDTLGAILWRVMVELLATARPYHAIPGVTLTFDQFEDSAGTPWSASSGDFTAQVGENILSVIRRLMERGLYVSMDPDTFELSAWEPDTHGEDRTGAAWGAGVVRFQSPTDGTIATGNIKSDAKRAIAAFIKRKRLWVGANDNYELVSGAGDLEWVGSHRVEDEAGDSFAEVGAAQLSARSDAGDTIRMRIAMGDDEAGGRYSPFEDGHVDTDDTVTVHTGNGQWDWNEVTIPVAAISVKMRRARDWDCWLDLGSVFQSMEQRSFQARQASVPQTHTHLPNPRLCGGAPATAENVILSLDWDDGTETIPAWPTIGQPEMAIDNDFGDDAAGGAVNNLGYFQSGSSGTIIPGSADAMTPCTPGVPFVVRGYGKLRLGGDGEIDLTVRWLNAAPHPFGLLSTELIEFNNVGWTLFEATLTPPPGAIAWNLGLTARIDQIEVAIPGTEGDDPLHGTSGEAARCDHGHIHNDLTDRDAAAAHPAAAVAITDAAGDFAATEVEGALAELQADAEADALALLVHLADTADAHDASAVSIADAGGHFAGTEVEAALQELGAAAAAGGIAATIVDAKGDLIAATANDAVDNLPVGVGTRFLLPDTGASMGLRWGLLHKLDATAAPAVTDDSGDGYEVGSRWVDVTNDKEYVCLDASVGAAVWAETTGGGGGSGAPTAAKYVVQEAHADLSAEQVFPELLAHAAGSDIDMSGAALGTGVSVVQSNGVYVVTYTEAGFNHWDVADAIGTGDFDRRIRIVGFHGSDVDAAGNPQNQFVLWDASRTATTHIGFDFTGLGATTTAGEPSAQGVIGATGQGRRMRFLHSPFILRISRVGTTVTYWVSKTEGRSWLKLGTGTSALNIARLGLRVASNTVTEGQTLVHWVRSV